ncbi:hypothetical protein SDC9_57797 [bioreactor metagenome]|uniref:Uncharacterized protein n=1 Tax=bioreactor metagenome TaxID=1076179 RepID=A0A644XB98_9ZZZZ
MGPCYQCQNRHVGCHATCEKYKKANYKGLLSSKRDIIYSEVEKYHGDRLIKKIRYQL